MNVDTIPFDASTRPTPELVEQVRSALARRAARMQREEAQQAKPRPQPRGAAA